MNFVNAIGPHSNVSSIQAERMNYDVLYSLSCSRFFFSVAFVTTIFVLQVQLVHVSDDNDGYR